MSGVEGLRALAQGRRPLGDGLIGNARCASGGGELLGEEAILAAFAARPFDPEQEFLSVETRRGAALIGGSEALVADLYGGRIGRVWHVGAGVRRAHEPAIDVAFDADLRQERGDLCFRAEDHPDLDPAASGRLIEACGALVEERRRQGRLRVRGFVVRAFGGSQAGAALVSLFELDNEERRSASFSYAVIGIGADGDGVRIVRDLASPRNWTPRF